MLLFFTVYCRIYSVALSQSPHYAVRDGSLAYNGMPTEPPNITCTNILISVNSISSSLIVDSFRFVILLLRFIVFVNTEHISTITSHLIL